MKIHIPTPLRAYAGKQPVVDVAGKDSRGCADRADARNFRSCASTSIPTKASCAPS